MDGTTIPRTVGPMIRWTRVQAVARPYSTRHMKASNPMALNYSTARFVASYQTPEQLPAPTAPEISFVGRSNVGKSSIMNKIFKRKGLVKVSSRPGSTQAINFFDVDGVVFADLPGYGFAKVPPSEKERWKRLIDGYFTQERRHALCVSLIDIRHDASKLDVQMVTYLMEHEIPFIIAFTKADKLSRSKQEQQVRSLCRQLAFAGEVVALPCSAETAQGVDDLRAIIEDALRQEKRG